MQWPFKTYWHKWQIYHTHRSNQILFLLCESHHEVSVHLVPNSNLYRSSSNDLSFVQSWLFAQFTELTTNQQMQLHIASVADGEGLKSKQLISAGVWSLTSTNPRFYHASPGCKFNLLDQGHHVSDHLSIYLSQSDWHIKLDKTTVACLNGSLWLQWEACKRSTLKTAYTSASSKQFMNANEC